MTDLLLYLIMIVIGSFVGNKILAKEKKYTWVSNIQVVAIIILVFTMGMRIGADDRVMESLQEIGIAAFLLTVFAMAGSVIAVFLVRRSIGLNRKGVSKYD